LRISPESDTLGSLRDRISDLEQLLDLQERVVAEQSDIAARRERELHEITEGLDATLKSIGDAVIATDVAGRVLRMNPAAERLTGWTLVEAAGKPLENIFRVVNEGTRDPVESPVERVLRGGLSAGLAQKTLLLRRDLSELPISDSCAPIRGVQGGLTGAVLVFRDMSMERLAKQSEEKTFRQLIFADRMASVGTLAAGVAHEINNPLAYVTANLDMIAEEIRVISGGSPSGLMKELEEMTLEARQGAERVRKIVRGLKTLSRSDEERCVPLDLRPILDLSINMAFNEIRHRARLVKDFGKTPPVDGDDARLGQVFVNLLVNAAQAIPEGDTEANEIRVVTKTDEVGRAVIEVRDSGAGIDPAIIDRIFDPFFTTKRVGVGTGLGLSICHSIVTGMGGEITVERIPGGGTQFRVVLPASSMASAPVALAPGKPAAAKLPLRGRVLVVDDDEMVGVMLGRVLRDHEVTVVTKGREALRLLASGREFDVILSDLMMPEMTGMQLHSELARTSPEDADRMIFLTGGAFTPSARSFLDQVPNPRLEKPFDSQNLRAMVQRFLH
jgi:PAS domain S-box-containing protein